MSEKKTQIMTISSDYWVRAFIIFVHTPETFDGGYTEFGYCDGECLIFLNDFRIIHTSIKLQVSMYFF